MSEIEVGEIWKDIEGYSNYQVSNLGRVKSKERYTNVGIKNITKALRKERILKPQYNTKKYFQVVLYDKNQKPKTFKVHRLVAEAFIPKINGKEQVKKWVGELGIKKRKYEKTREKQKSINEKVGKTILTHELYEQNCYKIGD